MHPDDTLVTAPGRRSRGFVTEDRAQGGHGVGQELAAGAEQRGRLLGRGVLHVRLEGAEHLTSGFTQRGVKTPDA